jgi:osmotically-inducible protein OsmY
MNDGESAPVRWPDPIFSFVPRIQHGPLSMSEFTPPPHFISESSSPDSELESSVRTSLQKTGYHQLRRLDVVVEGGLVRLTGRLPQFYLLQLAQQAVMKTEGVLNLDNGIEIVRV